MLITKPTRWPDKISSVWLIPLQLCLKFIKWTLIIYAGWSWGNYLNVTAYSRDRTFHTLAFLFGTDRPSEVLWSFIAPGIGVLFGDHAFEAASLITLGMIALGLFLHRIPTGTYLMVLFSPGIAYFLTNALRQGFALGVFLLLIALNKRHAGGDQKPHFRTWWIISATVFCTLIHNSIAVAGIYVIASTWLSAHSQPGHRSQNLQTVLLIASIALIPPALKIGGTAILLISAQFGILLLSFLYSPMRSAWAPSLALYLCVCTSGFLLTTTGLRIVIMTSILSLLVLPRQGKWLAFAGCVLYPIAQYGGYALEVDEEADQI